MGLLAWSASAQNWTVGGRIGSGFQAVGQYVFSNDNYVEARFGAYWANAGGTVTADFSVLYNWNVCNMDWTPSAGRWFFDAGAGINVGGKGHYAYVGVAGSAKLGTSFVRLVAGFRSRNRLLGRGIAFRVQRTGVVQLRYYVRLLLLKREPEEIKEARSNLLRASFMLSVRCFFCSIISPPLADEERFPRGGIEELNVIWTRNGCGRRRKTGWTFGYSTTCVELSLEVVFVYIGFVSGDETLFCFGRRFSWLRL